MKTNLTQAITIHSAYGVEVEYYDGQIVTVGPTLREIPKQLELFNYLLEKGYNVFGLSSEYVKEKAISKNNGSRDIGLVDMMDIDTY